MASIGSLVAELSANTATFQKDMGKAVQILNTNAKKMNSTTSGIARGFANLAKGLVAAFSVRELFRFTKSVIDTADHLGKLSVRTGLSVERLSEFKHGAELAGVSVDDMAKGLQKLAKNMAEAAGDRAGGIAAVFRQLNIDVVNVDGSLRDVGDVFVELADKTAEFADGTGKTAIQLKLLGKSGETLTPMTNNLRETSAEARRLGLITGSEFAKSSELFNDNLRRMGATMESFGRSAVQPLINLFNSLYEAMDRGDRKRLQTLLEEEKIIKERMEADTNIGTFYGDSQFNEDIENLREVQEQIEILQNKLAEPPKSKKGDKAAPVIISDTQIDQYNTLLHDLEKATATSIAAINEDEAAAAYERMAIVREEFIYKAKQYGFWVEEGKKATKEQIEVQKKLNDFIRAAEKEAAYKSRSPLTKLGEDWKNTAKLMQEATANWAQQFSDTLTEMVVTGKADFKALADSIISDLVRIAIQEKIIGSTGRAGVAGTGLLGLFGGFFASGGNPPVGRASVVGENGPELIVPRAPMTVIPNGAGGNVYQIDARGADRTGLARLENMIRQIDGSIEHRAVAAAANNRSRGGILAA